MSYFSPKLSILKQIIQDLREKHGKRNKIEQNEKINNIIKNGENNNKEKTIYKIHINKTINKNQFERIFNKYLLIKRKTFFREVKESKRKREFKFDKLNYNFNKFSRKIINPDYSIEKSIVSQKNILHDLNIDLTFEKIWTKLSSENYEKFNEKLNRLKDKSEIIFRKTKEDEKKCNSARNIRIKEIKKIFEDKIFDEKKEEKKINIDPLFYLLQRKSNKKGNNITNNINSARNKSLFSSQRLNHETKNIESLLLKRNTISLKNIDIKKIFYNIQKKSENGYITPNVKKSDINENNKKFDSKLYNLNTTKNATNKKLFEKKIFNKKRSRNKINKLLPINSGNNKSNFIQEYNQILKSNEKLKLKYIYNQ